ncbi:MAG: DUF2442 domain-containing protein [Ignavibacteriales bacterium]|nr:DUF2442 domain-containing protein [Ignavibacteriales bacterium]
MRIQSAKPLRDFVVLIEFTDGTKREVDLEPYLRGPIFEPLRKSRSAFLSFSVDHKVGTIVWANGADIDPDVLYKRLTPAWMETEAYTRR